MQLTWETIKEQRAGRKKSAIEQVLTSHCQEFETIDVGTCTFRINDVYCKDGIAYDNWVTKSFKTIKEVYEFLGY